MKISVIIPTFNRGKYISKALDSVFSQTYQDFEVIVVDDGSMDNTRDIVKSYISRFPEKVRYFHQPNKGISASRNKGIKESKGEFIAFLDSDDIWLPEKLSLQIDRIQNKNVGLVYSYAQYSNVDNGDVQIKPKSVSKTLIEFINGPTVLPTSTVMVKKECFDSVGYFNEGFSFFEDVELWIRIAKSYEVEFIGVILAIHKMHDSNVSNDLFKIYSNRLKFDKNIVDNYSHYLTRDNLNKIKLNIPRNAYLAGRECLKQHDNSVARKYFIEALKKPGVCLTMAKVQGLQIYFKSIVSLILSFFNEEYI